MSKGGRKAALAVCAAAGAYAAMKRRHDITVIGAGLAGSEAAWQLAEGGLEVRLVEMRPIVPTPVHKSGDFAELVCSNSFRSDDAETNAVGLLHAEMRLAGSLVMATGDRHKLPAGGALAVDRDGFAAAVTAALRAHPRISVESREMEALPDAAEGPAVVATGPLTSDALSRSIQDATGRERLAFFDAIAPIVHRETIDMDVAWFQSRYDKAGPGGTGADYINCPLDRERY